MLDQKNKSKQKKNISKLILNSGIMDINAIKDIIHQKENQARQEIVIWQDDYKKILSEYPRFFACTAILDVFSSLFDVEDVEVNSKDIIRIYLSDELLENNYIQENFFHILQEEDLIAKIPLPMILGVYEDDNSGRGFLLGKTGLSSLKGESKSSRSVLIEEAADSLARVFKKKELKKHASLKRNIDNSRTSKKRDRGTSPRHLKEIKDSEERDIWQDK